MILETHSRWISIKETGNEETLENYVKEEAWER